MSISSLDFSTVFGFSNDSEANPSLSSDSNPVAITVTMIESFRASFAAIPKITSISEPLASSMNDTAA